MINIKNYVNKYILLLLILLLGLLISPSIKTKANGEPYIKFYILNESTNKLEEIDDSSNLKYILGPNACQILPIKRDVTHFALSSKIKDKKLVAYYFKNDYKVLIPYETANYEFIYNTNYAYDNITIIKHDFNIPVQYKVKYQGIESTIDITIYSETGRIYTDYEIFYTPIDEPIENIPSDSQPPRITYFHYDYNWIRDEYIFEKNGVNWVHADINTCEKIPLYYIPNYYDYKNDYVLFRYEINDFDDTNYIIKDIPVENVTYSIDVATSIAEIKDNYLYLYDKTARVEVTYYVNYNDLNYEKVITYSTFNFDDYKNDDDDQSDFMKWWNRAKNNSTDLFNGVKKFFTENTFFTWLKDNWNTIIIIIVGFFLTSLLAGILPVILSVLSVLFKVFTTSISFVFKTIVFLVKLPLTIINSFKKHKNKNNYKGKIEYKKLIKN